MRMKYRLFLLLVALTGALASVRADGEPTLVEKVVLTNGTVLQGYMASQRPGISFTFAARQGVVCLEKTSSVSVSDRECPIGELSPAWKQWAEENDAFNGAGEERTLTLSEIRNGFQVITDVRILEDGAVIKYLELAPRNYVLDWNLIQAVKRERRPKNALSGLVYHIQCAGRPEVVGQYVEQCPGKTFSLLTDKNRVEVISTAQIKKQRIEGLNPDQPLFEQSPLLDEVVLAGGQTVGGIITELSFGDRAEDNYVVVSKKNASSQIVLTKNITEYKRLPNEGYRPRFDLLLQPEEMALNRVTVVPDSLVEVSDGGDNKICVRAKQIPAFRLDSLENQVTLEAHFTDEAVGSGVTVLKVELSDDADWEGCPLFSYEDLVKNSRKPLSVETSVNHITRLVFRLEEPGYYVVVLSKDRALTFELK